MKRSLFFGLILALAPFSDTFAFCHEPSAPSAPGRFGRPSKPSVPFCINEFARTHTCSDWEIENYRSDVRNFNADLEEYIRKLKRYVQEASEFASEALEYAKCEARRSD